MSRRQIKSGILALGILLACAAGLLLFFAQSRPQLTVVPDHLDELGMILTEQENSLYVLAVREDSSAAKAGVMPGDLLLSAGGAPLSGVGEFETLLGSLHPHDQLTLTLLRGENEMELVFRFGEKKKLLTR